MRMSACNIDMAQRRTENTNDSSVADALVSRIFTLSSNRCSVRVDRERTKLTIDDSSAELQANAATSGDRIIRRIS
ncbi:hypothetical protein F2P81_019176 [Scophthalmus maximus]|uniref:Pterin-binding domain-containing protein n=1 Tax=Scophthalmus maximus TaxID=52904 RepID=A0A6A4S6E5_SCOMX|nr:hypothetical protein F2P81_019176 [Scophthalmus maximus]